MGTAAFLYSGKDFHPFAVQSNTQEIALDACRCTSSFVHPQTGQILPEVDGFDWCEVLALKERLTPNMYALLVDRHLFREAVAMVAVWSTRQK